MEMNSRLVRNKDIKIRIIAVCYATDEGCKSHPPAPYVYFVHRLDANKHQTNCNCIEADERKILQRSMYECNIRIAKIGLDCTVKPCCIGAKALPQDTRYMEEA